MFVIFLPRNQGCHGDSSHHHDGTHDNIDRQGTAHDDEREHHRPEGIGHVQAKRLRCTNQVDGSVPAEEGNHSYPLTNDRPKCLVAVNGVPMVERQIQFLKEKGIDDITLISGYKAEALDFLKDKYGVDIVFNDRYDTCNNINSLYIVRDRFHDTYVLEGDVYMDKNVLLSEIRHSTYFARKKKYENEWGLEVDAENRLTHINIGDGEGYLMSGISYWKAEDCEKIVNHMEEVYATKDYTNFYWDNMVLDIYPELDVRVREIDGIYEIDTPEELKEVEKQLLSSLS